MSIESERYHKRIDELDTIRTDNSQTLANVTYVSSQHTKCAVCSEDKHTPLLRDEMGGYVCLTCIDKQLDTLESQRDRLLDAMHQCAKWFGEYADAHQAKGNTKKCMINISKQTYCLDVVREIEGGQNG